MITKIHILTLILACAIVFAQSGEEGNKTRTSDEPTQLRETVAVDDPIEEEDTSPQQYLDEIEARVLTEKLALLKQRMAYLE